MAAGVIQTLSKFRLLTEFQHPFLPSMAGQEMAFQYLSGEEDTEEEEEDEGEEEGKEEMELAEDLVSPAHEDAATEVNASMNNTKKTLQLLQFAERISNDIQRYFGRKNKEEEEEEKEEEEEEEEEESTCSTYKDFCSPPPSGRVAYYMDSIRISQHGENEDKEDFSGPHKPFEQLWRSLCRKDEKLGPLAELFEYGLCSCLQQHLCPDNKKLMRLEKKYAHVTPMQGRKLPQSFWREPALSPIGTPSGNPPDFSDLLANWTSESGQEELNASREQLGEVARDGH